MSNQTLDELIKERSEREAREELGPWRKELETLLK
jgi:hypothetical protein